VWAIEYEEREHGSHGETVVHTVAVSAESEYGAIKRLCGNRAAIVRRVELLDRKPQWAERRVEGYIEHEFSKDTPTWEYT
jgi:hypothetical protein